MTSLRFIGQLQNLPRPRKFNFLLRFPPPPPNYFGLKFLDPPPKIRGAATMIIIVKLQKNL